MKKLILSNHALKRMFERGINEQEIAQTMENPNYKIRRGDEIEAYKKFGNETLKVVYAETETFIKVITVVYI